MSATFTVLITADGTAIARDPVTGLTASGRLVDDAVAKLRRLLSVGRAT